MIKRKAFTLIELLVVIAIIGILSGMIVLAMSGSTNKARMARSQVFNNSLRTALMSNVLGDWSLDGTPDDLWTHTAGTANGAPGAGTECPQNSCYALLSASSQYISTVNTTGSYTIGANGMTAMVWIKGASQVNKAFFANWDNTAAYKGAWKIDSADNGTSLRVTLADTTTQSNQKKYWSTSGTVLDSSWHLVGFTWTIGGVSGVLTLYIDGDAIATAATTKTTDDLTVSSLNANGTASAPITIGADVTSGSATNFFNGSVDNARLYNATIPTSQIKEQYYAGLSNLLASGKISADEYSQRISTLSLNK